MKRWVNIIFCPKKFARRFSRSNSKKMIGVILFIMVIFLSSNNKWGQNAFTDQTDRDADVEDPPIKIQQDPDDNDKNFNQLLHVPIVNDSIYSVIHSNDSVPKQESHYNEISTKKSHTSSKRKDLTLTKSNIQFSEKNFLKENKNCPSKPASLVGNFSVDPNIKPSFKDVEALVGSALKQGGCFYPPCKALQKVAIIIPFKNRDGHLKTLLYYLHPILIRQLSYYCIFVAEQFDYGQFNKAMIMNAAYREVMKIDDFDCIVFHDVDMLPENDRNFYRCGDQPRHLSPAIDKFDYKPHYGTEFGGVTAITPKQYEKANGHSNRFWGWGGEDNDMEYRIKRKKMKIEPSPMTVGRYKMIRHRASWQFTKSNYRYALNNTWEKRADVDGLSDLRYRMVGIEKSSIFTKIFLDIRRIDVKKVTLFIDEKQKMEIDVNRESCRWNLYKEKCLDFNIPVFIEDFKKLQRLKPNETLDLPPRPPPPMPSPKSEGEKEPVPFRTTTKAPETVLRNFDDAVKMCEAMSPECRGITVESKKSFRLRRSGLARNLVIRYDDYDDYSRAKYAFPLRDSYVKYCPGISGYVQRYNQTLKVETVDLVAKGWRSYKFEVEFTMLIKPEKNLYYQGKPIFEAQFRQLIDVGHLRLSSSHYTLKPKMDVINETYLFETKPFFLPNVPGSYVMECKITDSRNTPHYLWNWYFEVSTQDKQLDARVRDKFVEDDKKAKLRRAMEAHKKLEEKYKKLKQKSEKNLVSSKEDVSYLLIPDNPYEENKRIPLRVQARRSKMHNF